MTIRILAAAMAISVSAACSKSPTTPETPGVPVGPSANSFEGVWTVKYTIAECSGYRHCVDFKGDTDTFYLHLARVGDEYEGVVDLGLHVSVSGAVGQDGTLKLTGRRMAAMPDDFDVEIDAITLDRPALISSSGTGAIRYITKGQSNSSFFGNAMKQGPITSVQRTGPIDNASSFTGTWTGSVAIRTCEATGWTHCYPLWENETYPVTLTLVPGASGVEGTMSFSGSTVAVTGSVSGSTVKLSGLGTHLGSGVTTTYALETDGLVVDRVGRLTGDVTLVSTYNWHDGRIYTVRYPPLPLYAAARSLR